MKYLIIGHPRCGTGFMSKLFKKNNLEVGHEKMGANGTSDWQYAIQDEKCFPWTKGVRIDYQFDKIIHNIRDPFTAIPSIAFTETPDSGEQSWLTDSEKYWTKISEQFRRKYVKFTNTNPFENAARSFLGWNKIIENQNPDLTVRIEYAFEDLKELEVIIENLGDKKVNSRQHNNMTKSQWNQIPKNTINMLEEFCLKYNYESLKKRLKNLQ